MRPNTASIAKMVSAAVSCEPRSERDRPYSHSSDLRTLQETRPAARPNRSDAPQQASSADFRRRHREAAAPRKNRKAALR